MTERALGYKRDAPDANDFPAERILGTPLTVVPASMRPFRVGSLRQRRASSCVAHALARVIDMSQRYALACAGKTWVPPKAARRQIYFDARRQEVVDALKRGEKPPEMRDVGCYPRLAMRAVQRLGYCDEALLPYSDDPQEINEAPPAKVYRMAYDQEGLVYHRVSSDRIARVAEVAEALRQGKPVLHGMFVDTAVMLNKGEVIDEVDESDPKGGGHMLAVVEVTEDEVIDDNWWGGDAPDEQWGAGGFARLSHRLFGSDVISDVYVVEAAPLIEAAP